MTPHVIKKDLPYLVKAEKQDHLLRDAMNTFLTCGALLRETLDSLELQSTANLSRDIDFYAEVQNFEINLIRMALRRTHGSQVKAARLLKLRPTTLNSKIKLYRIALYEGDYKMNSGDTRVDRS